MLKSLSNLLVSIIFVFVLAVIGLTTRKTRINWHVLEVLERRRQPCILGVWHNNLIYMIYILGPRRVAGMISRSRDGNRIALIARIFGLKPVRGSSSAGAISAVRESVRVLRRGGDLAVTPDGPRGPRYVVQQGMVAVAQMAKVPIVPICFAAKNPWEFGSWDRMKLPRPFSAVTVYVGDPIWIDSGEDDEQARRKVERAMRRHVLEAERIVGGSLPQREPLIAQAGDG